MINKQFILCGLNGIGVQGRIQDLRQGGLVGYEKLKYAPKARGILLRRPLLTLHTRNRLLYPKCRTVPVTPVLEPLASRGGGRRGNYPGARAPRGPENSVCNGIKKPMQHCGCIK